MEVFKINTFDVALRLHKSVHERLFKRELSRLRGGYTLESSFPLISAAVDTEKKATEGNVKRKSGCLQTTACIKKASLSLSFFPFCPSRSRPKDDEGKKSSLRDDGRALYLALKYPTTEEMGNRAAARYVRSIRKCEIAGDARYAVKYTRAEASNFFF